MALNLMQAHTEWATRPADQRFWTLTDLQNHTSKIKLRSEDIRATPDDLDTVMVGGDVRLAFRGRALAFTNWSWQQTCARVGAPAGYLATLPRETAAECLRYGLRHAQERDALNLLAYRNGDNVLRAVVTPRYSRIWNADIVTRLLPLESKGWQVPPARPVYDSSPDTRPATEADCLRVRKSGLSINPGDPIAPAGLYASDRDLFAFMVNEENRINDGTQEGLARGFFVQNSEVGDCAFKITAFLYRYVCGNHIVWDAKNVHMVRLRHIGGANDRAMAQLRVELSRYAESSAGETEQLIASARACELADNKDELLDLLFGKKIAQRATLEAVWDVAEEHVDVDGAPTTAWGFAQGMTRYSQTLPNMGERAKLDAAAGKILALAN